MVVSVRRTHAVADCSKSQMTSWKKLFCAPPPSVFLPLKRVHRRSKREKIWVKKTQQHIRASQNHVVEPLSASVRLIVGGNSHDRVRDVAFPFSARVFCGLASTLHLLTDCFLLQQAGTCQNWQVQGPTRHYQGTPLPFHDQGCVEHQWKI